MKSYSYRTILIVFTLSMITFSLFACTAFQQKTSEANLKMRVEGMMEAKINNDWGGVYDYLEPAYRNIQAKDAFVNKTRDILFTRYAIEAQEVDQNGMKAAVKINFDVSTKGFDFKNNIETQNWVKEEGDWYLQVPPEKISGTQK